MGTRRHDWALLGAAFVACAALALPASVAAQAQGVVDDPRLTEARPALIEAMQRAESSGLPSEWLEDKVREGLAKRARPRAILGAVQTLLSRMQAADALLAPVTPSSPRERRRLLRSATDALAAGAPAGPLGTLVREVAADSAASERVGRVRDVLVTVAELTERGFGGEASVLASLDAYRGGRRAGLGNLLERARRVGGGRSLDRDAELRGLGRALRRGVDAPGSGRDHGGHGRPDLGRGPR